MKRGASKWTAVGWHHLYLEMPEDWGIGAVSGDASTGYLRLDDGSRRDCGRSVPSFVGRQGGAYHVSLGDGGGHPIASSTSLPTNAGNCDG